MEDPMLRTRLTLTALFLAAGTLAVAALVPARSTQEMPQPGEQHRQLLANVGTWEGTMVMHMPGMPETPSNVKETIEGVGEFWAQSHFEGDFMGMAFHGRGCEGFDPAKNKYIGTWFDSTSPVLTVMEGEHDKATNSIVWRWEGPDMTGNVVPHRMVKTTDGDKYTSAMYIGPGEGTKTWSMQMARTAKRPLEAGSPK
jgi:GH18 family chitinase